MVGSVGTDIGYPTRTLVEVPTISLCPDVDRTRCTTLNHSKPRHMILQGNPLLSPDKQKHHNIFKVYTILDKL